MIRIMVVYYQSNIQKPDGTFVGSQSKVKVKDFQSRRPAQLKALATRITRRMMKRDGVREENLSYSGWFDVPDEGT